MRTLVISASRLDIIETCGMKFYWNYIESIVPVVAPAPLEKGGLLHEMLAHYYTAKMNGKTEGLIADAIDFGRFKSVTLNISVAEVEFEIKLFREYALHYANEEWLPIEVERQFTIILYEDEEIRILFEGKIDLKVETRDGIRLVDHKRVSRNSKLPRLANQPQGYCFANDTEYIYINRIGIQKSLSVTQRMRRELLFYDADMLATWKKWAVYWAKMADMYVQNNFFPQQRINCNIYNSPCVYERLCAAPAALLQEDKTLFFKPKDKYDLYNSVAGNDQS